MSNIVLGYRQDTDKRGVPIITYANSTHQALLDLGHTVLPIGEGHACLSFNKMNKGILKEQELFIDIDCGRNKEGKLAFHYTETKPPIHSVLRTIDDHGHPSFNRRAARNYDHVFFAVWDKRDIYSYHASAHWCPNASDAKYFYKDIIPEIHESRPVDVGFFGSKGGLDRADSLKEICTRNAWLCDVREIGKGRNRWPTTAESMARCKVLFNRNQKHDGPNQRVIEAMLWDRPLVSDRDRVMACQSYLKRENTTWVMLLIRS